MRGEHHERSLLIKSQEEIIKELQENEEEVFSLHEPISTAQTSTTKADYYSYVDKMRRINLQNNALLDL